MENFNTVPDKGTFGGSVEVINQNFLLAQQEMEILRNLISPDTKFVTAVATAQTTSVTQVLPETGSADTVYRVGSWDGSQYDPSVYSEYAWNGSAYIKLNTKSQAGEVYDISANHSGAKYADLAAALGTNGANIPQSLRKGGMSVKFVQSSDNKYVQFRYTGTSTANADFANVNNWQQVIDYYERISAGQKLNLELGSVFTNGVDYDSIYCVRTPNNRRIPYTNTTLDIKGILSIATSINQSITSITSNVHCYDSNGNSLGRTGFIDVTDKFNSFNLYKNTAYIRICVAFFDVNNQGVDVSADVEEIEQVSDQLIVSSINSGLQYVFERALVEEEARQNADTELDRKLFSLGSLCINPNPTVTLNLKPSFALGGYDYGISGRIRAYARFDWSMYQQFTISISEAWYIAVQYYDDEWQNLIHNTGWTEERTFEINEYTNIQITLKDSSEVQHEITDEAFAALTVTSVNRQPLYSPAARFDDVEKLKKGKIETGETLTLELGTINTDGTNYVSLHCVRTPNDKRLDFVEPTFIVGGILSFAKEINSSIEHIIANVHCYDSLGISLGRTGFYEVTDSLYVFNLYQNTAFIRICVAFFDVNNQVVDISNNVVEIQNISKNMIVTPINSGFLQTIQTVYSTYKKLDNKLDVMFAEKFPTEKTYYGDKISISRGYNLVNFGSYPNGVNPTQGMAIYGNYCVQGSSTESNGKTMAALINMQTRTKIADILLAHDNYSAIHCNVMCFGNETIENGVMPLLYASQWDGEECCFVYDIQLDGTSTLKQIISPANLIKDGIKFGIGYVDWIVDTDHNWLFAISYKNSGYSLGGQIITKFALPKVSDGTLIELTDNDIIEYNDFGNYIIRQDGCYNGNRLYLIYGSTGSYVPYLALHVIDVFTLKEVSTIDLQYINKELEGLDIYDGNLVLHTINESILRKFIF